MSGSVEVLRGDMFTSGADVLVVPTNCLGVNGKGLAKVFASRWPHWSAAYREHCRRQDVEPGSIHWGRANDDQYILAVATKRHWRQPSRLDWIRRGAAEIAEDMVGTDDATIAIPGIGCGLGELDWADVLPILVAAGERMAAAGVRVLIYEPHEVPRGR